MRLLAVRSEPLSVDEAFAAVHGPAYGGVAVFVGTVRDHDGGRHVDRLTYTAHPSAGERLAEVCAAVAAAYPQVRLAALHRVGELAVGELAVVVAAACPHRAEAFAAARRLIDEVKSGVPIWKQQAFADGSQEWVGCR